MRRAAGSARPVPPLGALPSLTLPDASASLPPKLAADRLVAPEDGAAMSACSTSRRSGRGYRVPRPIRRPARFALALGLTLLGVACTPARPPAAPAPAKPAVAAAASPAPAATQPPASSAPSRGAPSVRVPPPPAAPPAALDKVSYGIVSYNPFHWIAMIAQRKGLMEQYGI